MPTIPFYDKLKDIFNANEFGLFYQCLPNKTYHSEGQKCSEGQGSKMRLTRMLLASATGEKLLMLVIGKSKNLCCFKNVKSLPCLYKAQRKVQMDNQIFDTWICKFGQNFRTKDRKTDLLFNSSPALSSISNLANIQVIFLPPNTNSVLQLMDQSVIRCFKAH